MKEIMILIVEHSSLKENDVSIREYFTRLLSDATAVNAYTWVRSTERRPLGDGPSTKLTRAVLTIKHKDRYQHNGALVKMVNGSISPYRLVDIDARFNQIYSSVEAVLAPTLYDWYHKLNQTHWVETDTGVEVQDSIQLQSVTFKGFLIQICFIRQLLWKLYQENRTLDAGTLPVILSPDEIFSDVRAYCEKVPDGHGTGEWPQLLGANVELRESGNRLSIRGQLKVVEAIEPVICDLVKDPSHALWVKPSKLANGGSHNEESGGISLNGMHTEETFDKDVFDFLRYVKKKDMDKALGAPFEATFRIKGVTGDGHYYVIELQRPDLDKQLMDKLNGYFTTQAGKTHSQLIKCSTKAWMTEQSQCFEPNRDFVFRVMNIGCVKVTAELDRLDAAIAKVKSLASNSGPSSSGVQQREFVSLPPPVSGPLLAKLELNIGNIKVFIYQKDITQVAVESIVNAANGTLTHVGGVAYAIAQAAGRAFEEEGEDYIEYKGVMAVGDVYAQRACGSLVQHGIKSVINVVGPRYSSALGPDRLNACRSSLTLAITNTLAEAERLRLRSVAMPAISSGIYGVPMDICCEAYWNGLMNFVWEQERRYVREVHFVNIDEDTTSKIQTAFTSWSADTKNSASFNGTLVDAQKYGPTANGLREITINSDISQHQTTSQQGASEESKMKQATWVDFRQQNNFERPKQTRTADLESGSSAQTSNVTLPSSGSRAQVSNVTLPSSGSRAQVSNVLPSAPGAASIALTHSHTSTTQAGRSDFQPVGGATFVPTESAGASVPEECPICLEPVTNPRVLSCQHEFCSDCILEHSQKSSPLCPTCRKPYGQLKGNQPPGGTMHTSTSFTRLEGYVGCGTIRIDYHIPSGIQGPAHPNPGQHFIGTNRTAYLPDNPEGREALALLRKAFDAGLIFTVGTSHTSGTKDVVVWSDIHHKTSTFGGSERYGYPDPGYMLRLKEDLAAKGITP